MKNKKVYRSVRTVALLTFVARLGCANNAPFDLLNCFLPATPTGVVLRFQDQETKRACADHINGYMSSCNAITGTRHADILQEPYVQSMLVQIGQREAFHCNGKDKKHDTHIVLYHAQSAYVTLFQDLVAVFLDVFHGQKLSEVIPLRLPSKGFAKCYSIKELLDHFFQCFYHFWTDVKNPYVSDVLISTSPSLFSSVTNLKECSWDYFMFPRVHGMTPEKLVKSVFEYFGCTHLYDLYGKDLVSKVGGDVKNNVVTRMINGSEGWLLQIFIPKKIKVVRKARAPHWSQTWFLSENVRDDSFCKINEVLDFDKTDEYDDESNVVNMCVYHCKQNAAPYAGQTQKAAVILHDFRDNPARACQDVVTYCSERDQAARLISMQFRLFPHPEMFLDDKSGIKIFMYSRNLKDQKDVDAYWAELYRIVNQVKNSICN
ncbi:MAG: hypothetical protein H6679_05315 [Epsilonproteobacteria bacterium]|nr:hypothetical protein [Campylobacterota bacterium]